jgi:hypothetical protein
MPQFFKASDETENKFYQSGQPIMDLVSQQKDLFFDDAYACFMLGDLLYQTKRAPLTNAIPQSIFRETFSVVFDAFLVAGSFESYLTVFRKVFGDDVSVEFTVPGPGRLQIDIEAAGVELSDFIERHIVSNAYVFNTIIEELSGDTIVFQTVKGFQSQYDLEQMLFEMVPDGIYTEITLTLGS